MQLLDVGRQGLNLFCNYMDIGSGIAEETYNRIYDHIHLAAKKVFEFCCKKAVEEENKENEKRERPVSNFKVWRWYVEKKRIQITIWRDDSYSILHWKSHRSGSKK